MNFKLLQTANISKATKKRYIEAMEWKFPRREPLYIVESWRDERATRAVRRPPTLLSALATQLNARDFIAQDGTPEEVFVREETESSEEE